MSFSIWVLVIPVIGYLFVRMFNNVKRGDNSSITIFVFSWIVAVYGSSIAFELLIKRAMYPFYFYPAVPAVCLAIALGSWKLWEMTRGHKKLTIIFHSILVLFILATLASFIIMSPLGSNFLNLPLTI